MLATDEIMPKAVQWNIYGSHNFSLILILFKGISKIISTITMTYNAFYTFWYLSHECYSNAIQLIQPRKGLQILRDEQLTESLTPTSWAKLSNWAFTLLFYISSIGLFWTEQNFSWFYWVWNVMPFILAPAGWL